MILNGRILNGRSGCTPGAQPSGEAWRRGTWQKGCESLYIYIYIYICLSLSIYIYIYREREREGEIMKSR